MVQEFKVKFNMVDRGAAMLYFDTMFELARQEELMKKEAEEDSALHIYK